MRGSRYFVTFLLMLSALFTACSSTTLKSGWRDPEFQEKIRKVYVVGVTKVDIDRYQFEDTVSQELQAHGVTAIPSYKDLAFPIELEEQAIAERSLAIGADSVLMAHVLGKHNRRYEANYPQATAAEYQITTLEAILYDARTGKPLWSAQTETILDRRIEFLLSDFAKAVVRDMQKQGLF